MRSFETRVKLLDCRAPIMMERIPLGPDYWLDRVIESIYVDGCTIIEQDCPPQVLSEGIQLLVTAWRLAYHGSKINGKAERIRQSIVNQLTVLGADSQYLRQLGLVA